MGDRATAYTVSFCLVSKMFEKYDRVMTYDEIQNYQSNTLLMEDKDCFGLVVEY